MQALNSLSACYRGLSPAEDDELFETSETEENLARRAAEMEEAKQREDVVKLRESIETCLSMVVTSWNGDGEIADVSRDYR